MFVAVKYKILLLFYRLYYDNNQVFVSLQVELLYITSAQLAQLEERGPPQWVVAGFIKLSSRSCWLWIIPCPVQMISHWQCCHTIGLNSFTLPYQYDLSVEDTDNRDL